jgi:hypothetical protein
MEVQYEPLSAVMDILGACTPDAPRVHREWNDNIAVAFNHSIGAPERVFREAEYLLRETSHIRAGVGRKFRTSCNST